MKSIIKFTILFFATFSFGQTPIYQFRFDTNPFLSDGSAGITFDSGGSISYNNQDRNSLQMKSLTISNKSGEISLPNLPQGNNSRTISFWLKQNLNTAVQTVFSYGNATSNQAFQFAIDRTLTPNEISVSAFGTPTLSNSMYFYNVPAIGYWNHYIITHDGVTTKLYINGELASQYSQVINTVGTTLKFNKDINNTLEAATATLDDFFIYDVALTPSQVTSLFRFNNNQTPLQPGIISTDLVYANHFSDGNISDSSSTGAVPYTFDGSIPVNDYQGNANDARDIPLENRIEYNIANYGNDLRVGRPSNENFTVFLKTKVDAAYLAALGVNQYITFFTNGGIFMRYFKSPTGIQIQVGYERSGGGFTVINGAFLTPITNYNSICIVNEHTTNNLFKLYVNGLLLVSTPSDSVKYLNTNLDRMKLGISGITNHSFDGEIDDVIIYKIPLAAPAVQTLHSTLLSSSNFTTNNLKFNLYPNPSSSILNIDLATELESVEVYNLQGQKVLSSTSKQLNVSNLSNGIYMVRIEDENGAVATQKFVKN